MFIGTHPHLVKFLKSFRYAVNIDFISIGPEISGPIATVAGKELQRAAELNDLCQVTLQLRPSLILFTTFCLEAWHLGEKLSIPTIAVSFFPLDTRRTTAADDKDHAIQDLKSEIREHIPELLAALEENSPSKVSWSDVDLWMSSLFSDVHGTFRDMLGLSPLVFLDHEGQVCLPNKTPMLLAYEDSVLHSKETTNLQNDAYIHCGFWPCYHIDNEAIKDIMQILLQKPANFETNDPTSMPQQEIRSLFQYIDSSRSNDKELVYIGFGSMDFVDPRLTSDDFITHLLYSVDDALDQVNGHGIWLTSSENKTIPKVYAQYVQTRQQARREVNILMYHGPLPHELLLLAMQYGTQTIVQGYSHFNFHKNLYEGSFGNAMRECGIDEKHAMFKRVIAIHHGGAGTVARFIQLATVQIIVPFLFDQVAWAHSLQDLRFAPEPFLADTLENNATNQYPVSITASLWKLRFMRARLLSDSDEIYSIARDLYFKNVAGLRNAAQVVSDMMKTAHVLQLDNVEEI